MQDPGSDKKSIKKAYYDAMRDCHPDSNDNDEATEFATFLNEIYEVSRQTLPTPFVHAGYCWTYLKGCVVCVIEYWSFA